MSTSARSKSSARHSSEPHYDQKRFLEIRINSITQNLPLLYDVYIFLNGKHTRLRSRGETFSKGRIEGLRKHGKDVVLVPTEQRDAYLDSLRMVVKDPSSTSEVKGRYIKETAFVHVHDLFTKQDISGVVTEAEPMIEDMVNFVSTDVAAVVSLMNLSKHDYYTYNHCVDVSVYSIVLAKHVFGESKELLKKAGLGGLLHDIGKRQIDSHIINKPGALSPSEWEEVKRHPSYGKDILKNVILVPEESKLTVYQHHENYDGTGYPNKLKGEEISLLSRLVAIADVFGALTTKRSYHSAITTREALNTMFGMQPGKFDPNLFRSFNQNFEQKPKFTLANDFDPCKKGDK